MAGRDNLKLKEREFIVECIKLYKELPSLWNIKSKEYHDRDKKNAAYVTLLTKYREMFPQASKDDLKKRFNSLRTNYRKELKKYLQSMKSGDSYQPTLWYFDEMLFLNEHEFTSDSQSSVDSHSNVQSPSVKSERSSVDSNYTQEYSTTVGTYEATSTSYAEVKTKNKNLKRKFEDDLIQLAANRLTEKPDEYENWALSCAADIKKMSPMQQILAKKAIADIIMEGQLGLLQCNSVKMNTPTVTVTSNSKYRRKSTPSPTEDS